MENLAVEERGVGCHRKPRICSFATHLMIKSELFRSGSKFFHDSLPIMRSSSRLLFDCKRFKEEQSLSLKINTNRLEIETQASRYLSCESNHHSSYED